MSNHAIQSKSISHVLSLAIIVVTMFWVSNASAVYIADLQPISMCKTGCIEELDPEIFNAVNTIWNQADIEFNILPTISLTSTAPLASDGAWDPLPTLNDIRVFARRSGLSNTFFLGLTGDLSNIYGIATLGGITSLLQPSGFSTNETAGLYLAHLLGHNLGLNHTDELGNLMDIGDLVVAGKLTDSQISIAQTHDALAWIDRQQAIGTVAEPPTLMLFAISWLILFNIRRAKFLG